MSDIFNLVIPHQIKLERVKAGMQASVLRMLKQTEKEIYGEIMASSLYSPKRPSYRERRLKALLTSINKSINDFAGKAKRFDAKEMQKLRSIQAEFAASTLRDSLKANVPTPVITVGMLEAAASNVIVNGSPSASWWGKQSTAMKAKFTDRVRQGFIQGKTTGKIVQSIRGTKAAGFRDGIMKGTRQQIAGLVRSSVQTTANSVNIEFYKKSPLVEGLQWSSTLDNRTTIICIGLDGMKWDNDLNPIDDAVPFPGPTAHWACRSIQIPILVKWQKLAKKNKKLAKKLDEKLSPAMKQSMGGPVPVQSYTDWLRKQPDSVADEVLGIKKAQLWRDGKLTFNKLIDESARPLTVEELVVVPKIVVKKLTALDRAKDQLKVETAYLKSKGRRAPVRSDFKTSKGFIEGVDQLSLIRLMEVERLKRVEILNAKFNASQARKAAKKKVKKPPKKKKVKTAASKFYDRTKRYGDESYSETSRRYVENDANHIMQRYLRGEPKLKTTSAADFKEAKAAADDILDNWSKLAIETKNDLTVFRGFDIDDLSLIKKGATITDDGFWAVASEEKLAQNFVMSAEDRKYKVFMDIQTKAGTKMYSPSTHIKQVDDAFDLLGESGFAERELVLRPGTKVQIIDVIKEVMSIYNRWDNVWEDVDVYRVIAQIVGEP